MMAGSRVSTSALLMKTRSARSWGLPHPRSSSTDKKKGMRQRIPKHKAPSFNCANQFPVFGAGCTAGAGGGVGAVPGTGAGGVRAGAFDSGAGGVGVAGAGDFAAGAVVVGAGTAVLSAAFLASSALRASRASVMLFGIFAGAVGTAFLSASSTSLGRLAFFVS